jgi:hypothetical protein
MQLCITALRKPLLEGLHFCLSRMHQCKARQLVNRHHVDTLNRATVLGRFQTCDTPYQACSHTLPFLRTRQAFNTHRFQAML